MSPHQKYIIILQCLFYLDYSKSNNIENAVQTVIGLQENPYAINPYQQELREIVSSILTHHKEYDIQIKAILSRSNDTQDYIDNMTKYVLYIGIYFLNTDHETDVGLLISRSLSLAKMFSEEYHWKLINVVLDRIGKQCMNSKNSLKS